MMDKQRLRTFLLGGAVGALAGVLLAPRSGRELRSNLANRAGEAHERSRETYFEAQERLQERLSEVREGPSFSAAADREQELPLGPEAPPQSPAAFPERPRLREVSEETYEEAAAGTRQDELRRKVRETRDRLRERLEAGDQNRVQEEPDE